MSRVGSKSRRVPSPSQAFPVIPLDVARCRDVGEMLARAFDDDPVWRYVCPDPRRRHRQLAWMFEEGARLTAPLGECYVTRNLEGAAFWFPPDRPAEIKLWDTLRMETLRGIFLIGARSLIRGRGLYADVLRRHRQDLRSPHWVLDTLGVDPAYQRRGVAKALLQPILDRADAERTPCYVITHNPVNVVVYERFGFRVLERGTVHAKGLFVCSLRRPVPEPALTQRVDL